MILYFPDLDTLRLAMTSGVVPTGVSLAPASAGVDDAGHVWVQPSVAPSRTAQTNLKKLGVQVVKENGALVAEEVSCWPQLVPLRREGVPNLSPQAPVLFELADTKQLPALVGEMLRLGNDRQSFRYVGEEGQERVLLRVVGPPYYTLLRALERNDDTAPHAYFERLPRVWVEVGHAHPFVGQVQPPEGKLVLIRPPRDWTFLDDAPFRDIYEILDFTLPAARVQWREGELKERLSVPVRLTPGSSTVGAELWVVRQRAAEQLDALVGNADDRLLARLSFAIVPNPTSPLPLGERGGGEGDGPTVVLRARPSKQAAPVVQLECVSFRPFQKLPNLFLPCGSRLKPPLRRDAVRKLLADDPAQITWLFPQGDGRFVPESLPDAAFQPLERWVDYVLDQEQTALSAWVGAATFDFEAFVCKDDQPAKPRPREPKKGPTRSAPGGKTTNTDAADDVSFDTESTPRKAAPTVPLLTPQAKPNELKQRIRDLEKRFTDLKSPLDAPERQDLWREMALVHTALHDGPEAFVCWANAVWELETPPQSWADVWRRTEMKDDHVGRALDGLLNSAEPQSAHVRALTAGLIWAVVSTPHHRDFVARLDRIQRYLEQHDRFLSVRGAWLAWVSLTRLAHGDVLGLARARDRLLERLYRQGLSTELDLPSFLRFSGHREEERFRAVRERVVHLRELAQHWLEPHPREKFAKTRSYVDLIFAFGMARLGEANEARRLLHAATAELAKDDEPHPFLLEAFEHRIAQVLDGKGHGGILPAHLTEYLDGLTRVETARTPYDRPGEQSDKRNLRYVVDRLRENLRILEPDERMDAFRFFYGHQQDELSRDLASLPDVMDVGELHGRVKKLLTRHSKGAMPLPLARGILDIAPRLGEVFCREFLTLVMPTLESLPKLAEETRDSQKRAYLFEVSARLYERVLFLAAHYDQTELLHAAVQRFDQFLKGQKAEDLVRYVGSSISQGLRGLRKFGMRDSIERLLQTFAGVLLRDHTIESLREQAMQAARGDGTKSTAVMILQALVHVAGGWLYFERRDQAVPILDLALEVLAQPKVHPIERTALMISYASALSQCPVIEALERTEQFFRLPGVHDNFVSIKYYCLSQLRIIEAVVLAVVNDDFAVGTEVRRWLDDDEYLVRRRIHHDMKMALAGEMKS